MDIILVNRSSGKTWSVHHSRWHLIVVGGIATMLVAVFLYAGYWLGSSKGGPQTATASTDVKSWTELMDSLQAQVKTQQAQLRQAKATADQNADAMARKLAELQADVMRLNAAAQRMVEMAHIDSAEFDFDRPAAVGGPDLGDSGQPELRTHGMQVLDHLQTVLADRQREFTVLEDLLRTRKLRKETQPKGWPIEDGYISSVFGYRTDPFTGRRSFHPGIDIAGPKGEAVHAVAAGIVVKAGPDSGYGNMVEINHGNGVETVYGHNEKILVHVGQKVLRGQTIALEGSTGRSTGPHSHFEVRINGRAVNPMRFLKAAR